MPARADEAPKKSDAPEAANLPAGQVTLTIPPAQGPQVTSRADDPDTSDLLDGYAQQRFDAALHPDTLYAQNAGDDLLSGNDSIVYGILKEDIAEVAAGTRTSTVFEIDPQELIGVTSFTASDLGVGSILVFDQDNQEVIINPDAIAAADELIELDMYSILSALMADCPYEMYWYDKSVGTRVMSPGMSTFVLPVGDSWETGLMFTDPIVVRLSVIEGYAARPYEVDPSTGQRVETAVATAQQIVASSETISDSPSHYDRLAYFKDCICDLVSYDYAALSEGVAFGDSWQLVSVFDDDEDTNVVCEGYAKAFKYLCGLASMTGLTCRIVTGVMTGGTGAGDHMWNIVHMDDECIYLVDVTNCDEGTVGAPDKLFIAAPSSGSVEDGYLFVTDGGDVHYDYDYDTLALFSHNKLKLASAAYGGPTTPVHEFVNLDEAVVTPPEDQIYTGEVLRPALKVRWQGRLLEEGTDYSVHYTHNLNAGTARVTITGLEDNIGTATCTFDIEPRTVVLTSASAQKTYDGTDLEACSVAISGDGLVGPLEPDYTFTGVQHDVGSSENSFTYELPEYEHPDNYLVTQVFGTLTVDPRTVTVVPDEAFKTVGEDDPELTAHVENLLEGDAVTYELVRDSGEEPGSYAIHASGEHRQGNYEVLFQDGTFTIKGASIEGAAVAVNAAGLVYTGSAQRPTASVMLGGKTLVQGTDYTIAYANNVNAGTATVTVMGKGNYSGTAKATFRIAKAANGLMAKGSTKSVKAVDAARKAQKVKKAITVSGASGGLTYKLVASKKTKGFKVSKKTGVVTVPRGTKRGTYKLKLQVTAAGDANHEPASKTVTVRVKMK